MDDSKQKTKVKLYALPTCPYCALVRNFMKDKTGVMSVPQIEYEGEWVADSQKILEFLREKFNR